MEAMTALEAWHYRKNTSYLLLDVREPHEAASEPFDSFQKVKHIPMQEVPASLKELAEHQNIIVACHSGARSAVVCDFLRDNGFDAYNLIGGILAWSDVSRKAS